MLNESLKLTSPKFISSPAFIPEFKGVGIVTRKPGLLPLGEWSLFPRCPEKGNNKIMTQKMAKTI